MFFPKQDTEGKGAGMFWGKKMGEEMVDESDVVGLSPFNTS